jgi:hypothetical protein
MAMPPLREQLDIVRIVTGDTSSARVAIASTEREIALLREFRTRLIADLVTGKLDVREAAARLPDEKDDEEPPDEGEAATGAEGEEGAETDSPPEEADA